MATVIAWQKESDTKPTEAGQPGEQGLYFPPCPGVPDQCPPQQGNANGTFSRGARWIPSTT